MTKSYYVVGKVIDQGEQYHGSKAAEKITSETIQKAKVEVMKQNQIYYHLLKKGPTKEIQEIEYNNKV